LTKAVEVLATGETVRSIGDVVHDRLWDADLLTMVREFATDFQPPPVGFNGATGLYASQQDMFCFLIDPLGWAEIDGEAFAPGFFVWNSEVGTRPAGISTFWFQAVCQNHIIWDATEQEEFTCVATASADQSIREIRRRIEKLVDKRDRRRDGFVKLVRRAMQTRLGSASRVEQVLSLLKIDRQLAAQAVEASRERGRFTVFSVLDALTRANRQLVNAADRTEADRKAARLFEFVRTDERPGRARIASPIPAVHLV